MKRLTRDEFDRRFVRRPPRTRFDGLYETDLHLDQDAVVSGLIEPGARLFVHGDAHVLITGLVSGPVWVNRDAVLWVEGLVDGHMQVEGAACLSGAESVEGSRGAVVFDPTEPADCTIG